MNKRFAWLKRLYPFIFLLLQGLRYIGIAGILVCLGAAVVICWQHGFTGKWGLAIAFCFAFAVCFYLETLQVKWLTEMIHKLA